MVDEEPIRYNMTRYPSGYEMWEVILISIVVVFIMATIIISNLLVIVAIFRLPIIIVAIMKTNTIDITITSHVS